MSIKLVAIDIDRVLLDSQHKITPRAKEALQKANEQGVRIVLCTGRPLPGVKGQLDELALYGENDFVITYNDSLIQAIKDNTIILRYTLSYKDFLEIEMCSRKVGAHLHTTGNPVIYTTNRNIGRYTIHEASLVNMPLKYRTMGEMIPEVNITRMVMIDEPEVLDPTITKLPLHFAEEYATVRSIPFYYEIMNKNASKSNALVKLADHLGLNKDEMMTIGDNENDLSMIGCAGIGIVMGNATENVKTIVDMHTISDNEDDIAQIIEKMVLIQIFFSITITLNLTNIG